MHSRARPSFGSLRLRLRRVHIHTSCTVSIQMLVWTAVTKLSRVTKPNRRHFATLAMALLVAVEAGGRPATPTTRFGAAVSLKAPDASDKPLLVTEFGAVGNGVKDDTSAIQTAIDAASSSGRELDFPPGTYIVDPTRLEADYPTGSTYAFEMRSGMHLRGIGAAILKFRNNASNDANPRRLDMFFSARHLADISFRGLTFDGNWKNNRISPDRSNSVYNLYNQAFIGFWGASARGDNVLIDNCVFKNNAGTNNIVSGAVPNGSRGTLGTNWVIRNTTHLDGGMDTNDFTAIFGYAERMWLNGNLFVQSQSPTSSAERTARNAFEVHGARTTFTHNIVRNYVGGVVVSSNWSAPVDDVDISSNEFQNMLAYGVRLWRQRSGRAVQSQLSGIRITDNSVRLNSTLFGGRGAFKAGIYGASPTMSLEITDVAIIGNSVFQSRNSENISAAIYLQAGPLPAQRFDRFDISRNKASGTYYGIFVQSAAGGRGASWGTVSVRQNEVRNLRPAGSHLNPIAYFFRGTDGLQIDDLIFEDNLADSGQRDAAVRTSGLWLQGAITHVTQHGNKFFNMAKPITDLRNPPGASRG